jgi:hypothetical protein
VSKQLCGEASGSLVCDREVGHDGNHRGYNEQIDEPMFWPQKAYEYRKDGWPLCPGCGEDELWSRALDPRATDPLRCYRCGWSGVVPPAKVNS